MFYFWPCWVFIASFGLSLAVVRGLSLCWLLSLRSTGSRVHGLCCPPARGTFQDQGSNPRTLYQQVDSHPLDHQGSPCGGHLFTKLLMLLTLEHKLES